MNEQNKSGFSLVEVMLSILILVVLVLGSASVSYQTGGHIQRLQNKREAAVMADHILEVFWNKSYTELKNTYAGTTFNRSATVNGRTLAAKITVGAENTTENSIQLTVELDHNGADDDIILTTKRYKYGLSKVAP